MIKQATTARRCVRAIGRQIPIAATTSPPRKNNGIYFEIYEDPIYEDPTPSNVARNRARSNNGNDPEDRWTSNSRRQLSEHEEENDDDDHDDDNDNENKENIDNTDYGNEGERGNDGDAENGTVDQGDDEEGADLGLNLGSTEATGHGSSSRGYRQQPLASLGLPLSVLEEGNYD